MDKEQLKKRLEEIKSKLPELRQAPKESSYPTTGQIVKNLSQSIVNNVGQLIKGNNISASDQDSTSRLNICNTCEFFDRQQGRCTKCGCYMKIKAQLKAEKCPIGKW